MKRLLDILVSGSLLLILLVPGIIVSIALRLTGEGKILYLQQRVGKGLEFFNVFKLATMLENSASIGAGDITLRDDPRVLPLGKFLRKTKLNELPQLLNVFLGDMSLVGWRPVTEKAFSYYPESTKQLLGTIRPGLTGVGSVFFRDEEEILEKSSKDSRACYAEDIAPFKGELEVWYAQNQSFWLDLKIIFCTVIVVLLPKYRAYRTLLKGLPVPDKSSEIYRIRHLEA